MFGKDRASIVYLDTSFLSQFAKVEIGKLGVSSLAEKWRELLERLRQEVQRGTLICPSSQFSLQEALLSPQILPQFCRIRSELSKGYSFKDWKDILVHQTANQVLIYLGRPQDINLGWNVLTRQALNIVPPWATRIAKKDVLQFLEELRKGEAAKRSYAGQYEAERITLLQESFLQPLRQLQGLDTYYKSSDPVRDFLHSGFFGMLRGEANISNSELPKVLAFFESNLVDQIPYIYIFCSINTSLKIYEQARMPKIGDWLDVSALACAIPYCDIVTTDKNMKTHIVNRLQLRDRADIFTPTAKGLDALLERLSTITQ